MNYNSQPIRRHPREGGSRRESRIGLHLSHPRRVRQFPIIAMLLIMASIVVWGISGLHGGRSPAGRLVTAPGPVQWHPTRSDAARAQSVSVNWESVGPTQIAKLPGQPVPSGGAGKLTTFVLDMANPQIMYTAGGKGPGNSGPQTGAGIYESSNGGTSWVARDAGLSDTEVGVLWMDQSNPSVLLAGTWEAGLFRTSNGGISWVSVAPLGAVSDILQMGTNLYAATQNGVAKSTDDGKSWKIIESTSSPVRALSVSHSTLWAGLDDGHILEATEPANSWATVRTDPGATVWDIAANPQDPSTAFVIEWRGYQSSSLFETTDGGQAWTVSNSGMSTGFGGSAIQYVAYDVNTPGTLYAGADSNLYRTTNGGTTWSAGGVAPVGDVRYIATFPGHPNMVIAGTDQGIFVSSDSGASWASLNGNITSSILNDVAVSGNEILAPAQDYSEVESIDGGTTWIQPGGNCENGASLINPGEPTFQYLFTTCGFFVSSDSGASFSRVSDIGDHNVAADVDNTVAVDGLNPSTVYVAGASGIWKSTNWGLSFTLESAWPGSTGAGATAIAVSPTSGSDLYIGTQQGLYVSSDGGSTWTTSSNLQSGYWVSPVTIAVDPADPTLLLVGTLSGAVYRSTNGGISFSLVTPGPVVYQTSAGGLGGMSMAFQPGVSRPILVEVGTSIGVVVSQDGGQTWLSAQGNATTQMFTGLAWSSEYLYVSTFGEGVLKTQISSLAATPPTTTSTTTTVPYHTKRTIVCVRGKRIKRVTALHPVCPSGYRKRH